MGTLVRGGVVLAGLASACLLMGGDTNRAASKPSSEKLGKKIDNVPLVAQAGKKSSLHELKKHKAVVVLFLSFECPVSTNYSQPLTILHSEYSKKGVAFLGIVPNEDETTAEVARQAREFKIPFPVYKDNKLTAANAFKAQVTPEAFILDHNFVLRYRGRIDNGYSARLKKNQQITSHDLRKALDELLAGKAITTPVTQAIGCVVQREATGTAKNGKVTYYRDVLPILQNKCQGCHRPGEVGPFALMTYKQAVRWADDIKDYTQERKMPPWKPTDGLAFHNERKLSDREIATLSNWVDNGTPQGDPKHAPPSKKFPTGWQLGKPDLVLQVPGDFQVGPSGSDLFRCFVLPTNLSENKYVAAVEIRPSNPRVVHHALTFIDTTGAARKLEAKEKVRKKKETEKDLGPGYSSAMGVGFVPRGGLAGWAPGQMPRYLPDGTAWLLPKGSDLVMQLHYHRNGRLEKDRTSIGLYFAKKPVKTTFKGFVLAGSSMGLGRLRMFFTVPAGNDNYRLNGSMWVDQDCTVHNIMPHMHMIGKSIKVTMTPPDGKPQTLVAIKEWDYNWQETYVFKKPLLIKAGTKFDVEAFYDNSSKNPNNPYNPPRRIFFGQQTTNEMCFVFFGATSDKPGRIKMRFQPKASK